MVTLWSRSGGGNMKYVDIAQIEAKEANGRARSCGICTCTLRYVGIADSSTPRIGPYVIHDGPEFDEMPPGHLGVCLCVCRFFFY